MMQVTGEEGVSVEDYVTWEKARLVDMVYLQQDAFDPVDASMPLERQRESFALLRSIVFRDLGLDDKDAARELFTRLTGLYKNLNYSPAGSPEYEGYRRQIDELLGAAATER
jgi:V/A-type H+-transporting ATPase subunit A